ncbi:DUF5678 domain-containing protein [Patescibacteria group bacterium AH-259-L05]|nr:DUF5678 domain-containing protein [Patescibacteria group bacterium AH-259-L05]
MKKQTSVLSTKPDLSKNFQAFTELDRAKYLDNYIIMIDGKVRFSGRDIKKMLQTAKKRYPRKTPLIAKIPKEEVMVLIALVL